MGACAFWKPQYGLDVLDVLDVSIFKGNWLGHSYVALTLDCLNGEEWNKRKAMSRTAI